MDYGRTRKILKEYPFFPSTKWFFNYHPWSNFPMKSLYKRNFNYRPSTIKSSVVVIHIPFLLVKTPHCTLHTTSGSTGWVQEDIPLYTTGRSPVHQSSVGGWSRGNSNWSRCLTSDGEDSRVGEVPWTQVAIRFHTHSLFLLGRCTPLDCPLREKSRGKTLQIPKPSGNYNVQSKRGWMVVTYGSTLTPFPLHPSPRHLFLFCRVTDKSFRSKLRLLTPLCTCFLVSFFVFFVLLFLSTYKRVLSWINTSRVLCYYSITDSKKDLLKPFTLRVLSQTE